MLDSLHTMIEGYVTQLPGGTSRTAYGFPCFFAGERVFGLYDGDALVLKFDADTGDQLITAQFGRRFRHAATTSGRLWVRINLARVSSEEVLETLIHQSYQYVMGAA